MKGFLALLTLAIFTSPAYAFKCEQWVDNDGFKRWKCDYHQNASYSGGSGEGTQSRSSVTVTKPSPTGNFTVYDHTNGVAKLCQKSLDGRIYCR